MTLPWRKRLEYRLLRWQARLEGTAFNRTGPWIFSVVLFVLLLLIALARSREDRFRPDWVHARFEETYRVLAAGP